VLLRKISLEAWLSKLGVEHRADSLALQIINVSKSKKVKTELPNSRPIRQNPIRKAMNKKGQFGSGDNY
jgi:hypothetical protein